MYLGVDIPWEQHDSDGDGCYEEWHASRGATVHEGWGIDIVRY